MAQTFVCRKKAEQERHTESRRWLGWLIHPDPALRESESERQPVRPLLAQPHGELFVMRYDGTHIEQLTDNQWEDGTPAWQPSAVRQTTDR